MLVSKLELNLLFKIANNIFEDCGSDVITKDNIIEAQEEIKNNNMCDLKYDFCSSVETFYYCFSVLLSEIRQKKRQILTAIFEQKPELYKEKSVLKEKLDAEPEYASIHTKEEQLFQLVEHIQNIKNNVVYLYKEESDTLDE